MRSIVSKPLHCGLLMKDPCPVCDNMEHLSAMDMTPELVAEMASAEPVADYAGDELVAKRLEICGTCSRLIGGMTCRDCGCFVQFRVRNHRKGELYE